MNAVLDHATQVVTGAPWPYLAGAGAGGAAAIYAAPRAAARVRTRTLAGDWWMPFAYLAVIVLGVGALWSSVASVTALASQLEVYPPWLPAAVIDGAIAIFTGLDLALTRRQKRVPWLGRIQTALIAVTVILNVWGQPHLGGVLLHAMQPIVWKASVAALKATIAAQVAEAVERIPVMRWLLDPVGTFRLWRWMVLGRLPSYASAVEVDNRRTVDAIAARAADGKARPLARQLYTQLTGEPLPAPVLPQPVDHEEVPARDPGEVTEAPASPPVTRPAPAPRRRATKQKALTAAELLPVGREILAELGVTAHEVGRPRLREALKARGIPAGTPKQVELLELLRQEADR